MRPRLGFLATVCLASLSTARAFSCKQTIDGKDYDLGPLGGLREVSKESDTPPSKTIARVRMDLCSEDGVQREDGVDEKDQCPPGTLVCMTLVNRKADMDDRVTSVVPIWTKDASDGDVKVNAISGGNGGLEIVVNGADYAGSAQVVHLKLECSSESHDANPTFDSYSGGSLYLTWASPDACPRGDDAPSGSTPSAPGSSPRSGGGFFSFLKMVFWLGFVGLVLYFVLGIAYNHNNYSAKGWDLIPHRDFWREVPALANDLWSHLMSGIRGRGGGGSGNGGRGGYSSL